MFFNLKSHNFKANSGSVYKLLCFTIGRIWFIMYDRAYLPFTFVPTDSYLTGYNELSGPASINLPSTRKKKGKFPGGRRQGVAGIDRCITNVLLFLYDITWSIKFPSVSVKNSILFLSESLWSPLWKSVKWTSSLAIFPTKSIETWYGTSDRKSVV